MELDTGAAGGGVEVAGERSAKRQRVAAPPSPGARRRGSGRRRRVQAEAAAVQRLFQACRAVFRGPGTVPAPAEVHLLCSMIGALLLSPCSALL
jgi:plant cysteine oxidase